MIELPTRRRLVRRRDRLYLRLWTILSCCTYQQVEEIMRQIHNINLRLRTYFNNGKPEPEELFIDPLEDYDITTQDTTQGEIAPTLEELAQIEEQLKKGEI